MNQFPVSSTTLGILLRLRWVIERKLDVVKRSQIIIFEKGNTVTIGSDGELRRASPEVRQDLSEVRMHSVLPRSQIHRTDRKSFHHCLHLIQGETVRARWVAVAERACQIALVGKPEPQRNASAGRHHATSR